MTDLSSLPAALFRGGTSKGLVLRRSDVPDDRALWDDLLLAAFGSPDPMQIDGVGGSHSTASKAIVVSPGDGTADVAYRFGGVAVDEPVVDWGGNCGNMTFATGPAALELGVVPGTGDDGRLDADDGRIRAGDDGPRVALTLENGNTGGVVEQSVPVDGAGAPRYAGDFAVDGVPGTGARIVSRFLDPGGSETSGVFPTGERTEPLDVAGVGTVAASLVDVASPCVFVRATDLGLTAAEPPATIDADPDLVERLERVRAAACVRYGFVDDPDRAAEVSPGIPKLAVVGERRPYPTVGGGEVRPDEYDLLARIMSMGKAHHAYAVTGAMCTAVAATLPGTVPAEFAGFEGRPAEVTIGHPKGTMTVGVDLDGDDVVATTVDRTARKLMTGELYHRPVGDGT